MVIGKDKVEAQLREGVVTVTFTKKDGTERVMRCTTASSHIPADKAPKGSGVVDNPDVAKVFDLDINEWRSFRFDSVKSVN